MSEAKKTYFDRAIEISTANQNCQDDNWGDWCNLCAEADLELKVAKLKAAKTEAELLASQTEANNLRVRVEGLLREIEELSNG